MNKIIYTLLVVGAIHSTAWSQSQSDQRTLTTRIADLLALMPSNNAVQLKTGMEEISGMGEEGLVDMLGMLSPSGQGNNSQLQYAVGSYSGYVTQKGRENERQMSVRAYCQALANTSDKENKAFIISQLQIVGKDDAVSCLKPYLNDDRLYDNAARALVTINTTSAKQALLQALPNAKGGQKLSIVEALGDSKYNNAVKAITQLTSSDENLSKISLYALANIADPSSESVLASAAEKSGFIYENKNAVSAYLLFAENLAKTGNQPVADKIVKSLIEKCTAENQVHVRTAALKLLTDMHKSESMSFLIEASGDQQAAYRAAALKFAAPYMAPATTALWVKKIKKSKPEIQAAIIKMLGDTHSETALPAILKLLKSKNSEVRSAAVLAAGKIGQEEVLDDLFTTMKKGVQEDAVAVQSALLMMKGNSVTDKIADAVSDMPPHAKDELIQILAARRAHTKMNIIYPLLESDDNVVRKESFDALKEMATDKDLPTLFSLLDAVSDVQEVIAVQEAIIAATQNIKSQAEQTEVIVQQMEKASEAKKPLFYKVLANIGGQKSLNTVISGFTTGNSQSQKAALEALSSWSDVTAAAELIRISRETSNPEYHNQALRGYVRAIALASYPADQKVIMLKDAMEVAKTDEQKRLILKQAEQNKTFNSLVFAGRYLNDSQLQQDAAMAVMNIALSNKNYYGTLVENLLNKTIDVIKGPDSEYQKESIRKHLSELPKGEGFVAMFNGKDLTGWKGLVANPIERAKMDSKTLAEKQKVADEEMRNGWKVQNGELLFTGHGNNLASMKKYGDFEMLVDWKIYNDGKKEGDAGIYLRGTPQVQIWDTARVNVGAQVGSGGLYNNKVNPSKPLKLADNGLDQWNNFRILMIGDRVTVYLNGELVTDNVILENFWDAKLPIFPEEQIELQAHGSPIGYRDIYIREIERPEPFELSAAEKKEGFKILFDGTNMYNWKGNTKDYVAEDGNIVVRPKSGSGGNLYTKEEYGDFVFRFDFMLTPGANNGLGIRAPLTGDAAYEGMEIQILDNDAPVYKDLKEYQYHGSVYGVLSAKRGFLKPLGEWNYQEVFVKGNKIKVTLNGTVILDGDIAAASKNGTLDGNKHPGLLRKKGYIGFLGHGSEVRFRNIRVRDLGTGK